MMIIDQEKLVDNIIVNDIVKTYPELKELIEKCSPYEVRGKILSVLDPRNDLHYDYREFHELNLECDDLTYLDEITTTLRNYVRVADTEVKTLGEVMTPIWLVEEMLDTLPNDVWSNPNLKWLDPCAGVGTFYSIVVQRLMKGLKKAIPNKNKRYRHIIENMLFACELQAKNMFIYHCIYDRPNIFELNTFYGSFLTDEFDTHMKEVWGVEKFDIVIGNPPYQTSKEGNKRTHAIWNLFVDKSLNILIEDGFLVMVHPDSWRGANGKFTDLRDRMLLKEISYIKMNDSADGMKTFGVQTTYDYYCLKNKFNDNNLTTIVFKNEISKIKLSDFEFIPNGMFNEYKNLIAKDNEEKINMICDSSYHTQRNFMSREKNSTYKYPVVYVTNKDGDKSLWYSSTNENGHFGIPKVIFSNGTSTPFVDSNGEYAVCQYSYGIVDSVENLEKIQQALLNPKFMELIKFSDGWSNVSDKRFNRKVIATFRKDFYKQFLND